MSQQRGFGAGVARWRRVVGLAAMLAWAPAQADTILPITSTAQEVTLSAPTGVANGNCTLGEAFRAANTNATVDGCTVGAGGAPFTLVLAAGATYTLTAPAELDALFGPTGLPPISGSIILQGNGATLTRGGAQAFRFFRLVNGGALQLQSMTVSNGRAETVGTDNLSGTGGVFVTQGAAISFVDCLITESAASYDAAVGLMAEGTTSLLRTEVRGFSRLTPNPGAFSAFRNAAGLPTPINIANSTISGGEWAFVVAGAAGSALRISNSTLAVSDGSILLDPGGSAFVQNSVLTRACQGAVTGTNNRGNTSCPATTPLNQTPTLANNGGPTRTFGFLPPANTLETGINCVAASAGNNPLFADAQTLTTDQRGFPRPVGAACDIGAFEGGVLANALAPASLPDGTVGAAYAQTVTASGGVAPYGYAVTSGTLPPGVPMSAGGNLAGTPFSAGTFGFTVRAADAHLATTLRTYAMTIAPAATTTVTADAFATYRTAAQPVPVSASVTLGAPLQANMRMVFSLRDGATPVGSPVTVLVNGAAVDGSYALPAATPAGTYTLHARLSQAAGNFAPSEDEAVMVIAPQATTTATGDVAATYSTADRTLALSANVVGTDVVNTGAVTFTLRDGAVTIGDPITAVVVAGAASGGYTLPGGLSAGNYTVHAAYLDADGNFVASIDEAQVSITPLATTVTASDSAAVYSTADRQLALSANVSAADPVDAGVVTFTLRDGGLTIGSPITVPVLAGVASGAYTLPGGTPSGSYTVHADYSKTAGNIAAGSDESPLVIAPQTTTLAANDAAADYGTTDRALTLAANVAASDAVNAGVVTFTLRDGALTIGSPITATVVAGTASGAYTLPGGTPAGSYSVLASYADADGNFVDSTDDAQLAVGMSASTLSLGDVAVPFSASAQNVSLSATATSGSAALPVGQVTFQVRDGAAPVGAAVTAPVNAAGVSSASYALPASIAPGGYRIEAAYSDAAGNYAASTSSASLGVGLQPVSMRLDPVWIALPTSPVSLRATLTAPGGTVVQGEITFVVRDAHGELVGAAQSAAVVDGTAQVIVTAPGGTWMPGNYTIRAEYVDAGGVYSSAVAGGVISVGARVVPIFGSAGMLLLVLLMLAAAMWSFNSGRPSGRP